MDQLRITAAYCIKESKLTKAAKLQLMNFLENEASDAQVMALILDEMAEEIVNDRWDSKLLEIGPSVERMIKIILSNK